MREQNALPRITHYPPDPLDPVKDHLLEGNEELGSTIIGLAERIGTPLTFDLLHYTPTRARFELSHRVAHDLLEKRSPMPAPKTKPAAPDDKLEAFHLWVEEDRRIPEGAWRPFAIILGAALWVPIILGAVYLVRAVL